MSIIDTLITDRTASDVSRWQALFAKGWSSMTTSERTEWMAGMRGAYNAADLNRVGEAVAYAAGRLGATGYGVTASPKTDWSATDIPTAADLTNYLNQIEMVRTGLQSVLMAYAAQMQFDFPQTPSSAGNMTYQEANDIEQILKAIYDQLKYMEDRFYWYCSGDLYAGEV